MKISSYSAFTSSLILSAVLTACGGGGGGGSDSDGGDKTPPPKENQAKLTGQPKTELNEMEDYQFSVNAVDFSGQVTFSIENKPAWARFSASSGTLSGTPSTDDAGIYPDIKISASDGSNQLSLPAFSIEVFDLFEISGVVVDGYISGALVYVDENDNSVYDNGEISALTNVDGAYILYFPLDKLDKVTKSPLRAYLGEGAKDESRPEIDFSEVPVTLSLAPVTVPDESNQLEHQVISPFSNQVVELVEEQIRQYSQGEITLAELEEAIESSKAQILAQVVERGSIELDEIEYTQDELSQIVFGDFLEFKEVLPTIIEQGEQLLDDVILASDERDFDQDGTPNNVDPDDDNDGVDDDDDLYPFDAAESSDSDNDGVGDNADAYPQDSNCSIESHGDGSQCYVSSLGSQTIEIIESGDSDVIHYYLNTGTLLSIDSLANEVTNVLSIDNLQSIEYVASSNRLYLGDTSGEIRYLNANYELNNFASVEGCVNRLLDTDNYLVALDCSDYNGSYISLDNSGNIISHSQNYYETSSQVIWDSQHSQLLHFRDGISPNDIHTTPLNAQGEFGYATESPYHGDYTIQGPITLSYDSSRVLLGSGDLYDSTNLNWLGSVSGNFQFANWLSDDSLVTYHVYSVTSIIYRRDDQYRIVERLELPGQILAVFPDEDATGSKLIIRQGNQINYYHYVANDDSDNDGVENTLDAFPTDAAASIDSDGDGYPDEWNTDKTAEDSTSELTLDAFPQDSACWLDAHGENDVCDYSATMPDFTPDQVVADSTGNIYLFSESHNTIYVWSAEAQAFRNPIKVGSNTVTNVNLAPQKIAYSENHNRIYLGYSTGEISYVDLSSPTQQMYLTNIAMSVDGLAAVGNYILAQDNSGAWETHYIIDRNGTLADSRDWNHYSRVYAWNDAISRVYFFRDGTSPNDLHYEEINQLNGTITSDGETPYHSDYGMMPPIVISEDNSKVFLGNGDFYDASSMAYMGSLNVDSVDLISMPGVVVALKANGSTASQAAIWRDTSEGYEQFNTLDYQGAPIAVKQNGDNLTLVTLTNSGFEFNQIILTDGDEDGLPAWWELAYGLSDSDSTDAAQDSDEDGLTNLQEYNQNTLPNNSDSDDDGINDGDEINTYQTDPLNSDTDMDGLSDGDEVNTHQTNPLLVDSDQDDLTDAEEINEYQSNPLSNDSDDDGLIDSYEVANGLDLNTNDAELDLDEDGLNNFDENLAGTDPRIADTDNDGLSDGLEVHTHLTEPLNRDSDNDKMSDGWEVTYEFDPLDNSDQNTDFDEDGYSNQYEFFLNSDPTDATSMPEAAAWNGLQGNAAHSGFIGINIAQENLSLSWSVDLSEYMNNTHPLVAENGKVVAVGTGYYDENSIVFLNSLSGNIQETIDMSHLRSLSGASLNDGNVYFHTRDNQNSYLYGYNLNSGDQVLDSEIDSSWSNHLAPTIYDNAIYMAGGYSGRLYKMDPESGEALWSQEVNQCDGWAPAVDENHVYYYTRGFYIANKATGEVEHSNTELDSYECLTPVLGNADDAFIIIDRNLYAFDTQTAEIKWRNTSSDYYQRYFGMPAVGLDKVYALKNGDLVALDVYTGEQVWSWSTSNHYDLRGNIAISMNLVFVQDYNNTYAIDVNTHEQVWSYPTAGSVTISKEGTVYITSGSTITAFDIGEDRDEDGIYDWWEDLYGLDKNDASDAEGNLDEDELTNLEEFNHATNPLIEDSDSDGLSDSDEVNHYLSNPVATDTDSDGMPDGWEVEYELNLIDDTDALVDADGDTISNLDEYSEGTDPTDITSLPEILTNQTYSFEEGQIPTAWVIDTSYESSWGITALEQSHGDYSLFSSGYAAINYSAYFNGNYLSFDAKSYCAYSNYINVYVDQVSAMEYRLTDSDIWETFQVAIPRGRHTVKIETSCGMYLDNVNLEPLPNLLSTDTHLLTLAGNRIRFYNFSEQLTDTIWMPTRENSYYNARDLTVLENGLVAVFNGVFEPALSIYNSQYATWEHYQFEGWGIVNNGTYGGIDSLGTKVYLADMDLNGSDSGILVFDTVSRSFVHYEGNSYIDLSIGLDNKLYALTGYMVDVYNPENMELLDSFAISQARALEADAEGNIYTASWDGKITQYSAQGIQLKVLNAQDYLGSDPYYYVNTSFYDIEIDGQGSIYLTNRNERVLRTTTELNHIEFMPEIYYGNFATLMPVIDKDEDGMPLWWESRYGLSDDDATDAELDADAEGLLNLEEYLNKSDPSVTDTDDDGLDDYAEVKTYGTNPAVLDSDDDGLSDGDEVNDFATDPLSRDSDQDGFSDGVEISLYETDPNDANSLPDAIAILDIDFNDQVDPDYLLEAEGSAAPWGITEESAGNYVYSSGDIDDRQLSAFELSGLFAEGTLSFDARVSSENCCDRLVVFVDGVEQLYSVENSWETFSVEVASGQHTIRFAYQKDGSVSSGEDKAWVDNLKFTP